jgi:hypothetical protein
MFYNKFSINFKIIKQIRNKFTKIFKEWLKNIETNKIIAWGGRNQNLFPNRKSGTRSQANCNNIIYVYKINENYLKFCSKSIKINSFLLKNNLT